MEKISVFGGTGFIGSHYCKMFPESVWIEPKSTLISTCRRILYLISTTDNYNV